MAEGYLTVYTNPSGATFQLFYPGSWMFVEGFPKTTNFRNFPVEEGTYDYRILKDGYHTKSGTLIINPGETTTLNITLVPESEPTDNGILVVQTDPAGALFYLYNSEGNPVSTFPRTTPFSTELPPGHYSYRVHKEGYDEVMGTVDLYSGITTNLNVSLTGEGGGGGGGEVTGSGILNVNTNPSGATFDLYLSSGEHVDGFPRTTPFSGVELPVYGSGSGYTYIISKDGYETVSGYFMLFDGDTVNITRTLSPTSTGGDSGGGTGGGGGYTPPSGGNYTLILAPFVLYGIYKLYKKYKGE